MNHKCSLHPTQGLFHVAVVGALTLGVLAKTDPAHAQRGSAASPPPAASAPGVGGLGVWGSSPPATGAPTPTVPASPEATPALQLGPDSMRQLETLFQGARLTDNLEHTVPWPGSTRSADAPPTTTSSPESEDPALEMQPAGPFHVGMQLAGAIAIGNLGPHVGGELALHMDFFIARDVGIRLLAPVSLRADQGFETGGTYAGHGTFSVGGRVLVGWVGPDVALRIGADCGSELLSHSQDTFRAYYGGTLEFAVRALEGHLEILLDAALLSRPFLSSEDGITEELVFSFTTGLGYVF